MNVLGIETSCDETSVAVVKGGSKILSNVITSSLQFHRKYGGVVPEIAFRKQLESITGVADASIKEARINLNDLGLVTVTSGPGLLGSLLVGISFAKSLSHTLNIPLVGIDHVHSHIYANFLNGTKTVKFPFVALVVSGGHTSLFFVKDFDEIDLLGSTLDDACGEAFDKVAKILELGYPGGPHIERLALKGDAKKIKFRCSETRNPLDFSFSGIKTGVLYYVQREKGNAADVAASFQESVIEVLIRKSLLACERKKVKSLVVGGGVVANKKLREKFSEAAQINGLDCFFPPRELCTDNAAMVAGFGYQLFKKGKRSDLELTAELN